MAKKKGKNKQPVQNRKPINLYIFTGFMIVLLPLLFSHKAIDPVLSIRLLAWTIFMLIMVVPVWFGAIEKKLDFRFLWLGVFPVFLVYFLIVLISGFFALNLTESYFDFSKTFLSIVLLIFATAIFLNCADFQNIITRGFVISTLIAGLNGVFQYFNISPVQTDTELFSSLYEIGGIMGHKNQFAISLFLMLPFCIYGVFAFKRTWLALSVLSLIIIFVNIVLLQTRSVWVATVIFIFAVATILYFIGKPSKEKQFIRWYKNPVFIAAASFVAIATLVFFLQTSETKSLIGYKISSLMQVDSHDNEGRLEVWGSTFDIIKKQPLTGVGAGNWKIHIPVYIADKHGREFKNWKQPHNDFLWILSEKGIFGLLAYVGIFGLILRYGIAFLRRHTGYHSRVFASLILAAIIGYLALALVTFPYDRINHQVVLMIMFAAIISLYFKTSNDQKSIPKKLLHATLGTILVVLIMTLAYSITLWNASKNIRLVYAAIDQNNPAAVVRYATDAISKWVSIDQQTTPIYKHRGTANSMLGRQVQAIKDLEKAREAHPYHVNTLVNLATIYARENQLDQAIKYFEEASVLFPKNQSTIKSLARAYYEKGRIEDAYAMILKYNNNKPDIQVDAFREELVQLLNNK